MEPQKVSTSTAAPPPPPEPWMSGKERRALVSHLRDLDLESGAALVLTPRQKVALRQELEARRMGLAAWTDLTPWQKLSRAEQRRFNDKYLALPVELQVRRKWINVISDQCKSLYCCRITVGSSSHPCPLTVWTTPTGCSSTWSWTSSCR